MTMRGSAYVSRPVAAKAGRLFDLHVQWPHRYPAYLESAAHGAALGRYDLLFAHPSGSIGRFSDGALVAAGGGTRIALPRSGSFLEALDAFVARERSRPIESSLPFTGGWVVFVGYEIAREIEPRLRLPVAADASLEGLAVRIPAALIYEHDTQCLHVVAEAGRENLLDGMEADLRDCPPASMAPVGVLQIREDPPERYLEGVHRAKDYIRAGDVYQVNLSRGWSGTLPQSPERAEGRLAPGALYASLRTANPAPFAASLVIGDLAILSSSPERLFSVRDGGIATRPIAGTRLRTRQPGADEGEKATLVAHPKERAEHVMLIDLERNDLGRICRPGSVQVDEFMALESYEHVHHIVSNVRGRLREGVTPSGILGAVFPGGTITGCPKIRCMEIIAELEGVARCAYTGSLGYLNRDGSGDFNILIRTMTCSPTRVLLRAGAGIVADSIAERELEETRAKARGLLRALGQPA